MPDTIDDQYLCEDGQTWFAFQFVELRDGWRIYITYQPDYRGRPADGHSTHRYYDSTRDQHYICWSKTITSFEDAKAIAKAWAEHTQGYCTTGRRF